MSEAPVNNGSGFDPENIARVYRGEPALVGEKTASDILTPRVLEAASYSSQGLSYEEIAGSMGNVSISTVRTQLMTARGTLGILSRHGFVAYCPPYLDDEILEDKRLADLGNKIAGLETLESLSVGMNYKKIAQDRGLTPSTLRTHTYDIGKSWQNVRGSVQTLGVANALRTRYIRAIESAVGTDLTTEDVIRFTLPKLAKLEPAIRKRYAV